MSPFTFFVFTNQVVISSALVFFIQGIPAKPDPREEVKALNVFRVLFVVH